jgi:hypothetical protein
LDKIPFSTYDFFAYLSSGVVIIAAADYVWGLGLLTRGSMSSALAVVLVILAYVTGQIVAHFSSLVFEQFIVHRILRPPTTLLLGGHPRSKILKWIFPNYHRVLPIATQQRIRAQFSARGFREEGEALFLHAYSTVTADERLQARLDGFRNQYGFARNMAFAFLLSACAISEAHWYGRQGVRLRWAVLGALAGLSLFYRYLKFFRQYSYELFLRYAELPVPNGKDAPTHSE